MGATSSELRKTVYAGNVYVAIVRGDLCSEKVDVIVSTVSSDLDLKKGRASRALRALKRAAGKEFKKQCYRDYPNGLDDDKIAVLNPGNLSCKKVYLVTLSKWTGPSEEKTLYNKVMKCLEEANKWDTQSLAMIPLGTGRLTYPADKVGPLIFQCIEDFSSQHPNSHLNFVSVVVHSDDKDVYKAFVSEARRRARQSTRTTSVHRENQRTMTAIKHGKLPTLVIKPGKLATFKAGVLVNSTSTTLQLKNGGLSESLLKVAGQAIQKECDNNYPDGIKIGKIAVTCGYGLSCKKVYHGALPKWNDESRDPIKVTECFVTDCLELASKYSVQSIAFPTLGTGGLGYPPRSSASAMHNGIWEFIKRHPTTSIKHVTIAVYDEGEHWKSIQQVFEKEFHSAEQPSKDFESSAQVGWGPGFYRQMFESELCPPTYWETFHSGKTIKEWDIDVKDQKAVLHDVDQATFDAVKHLVKETWKSDLVGQGRDAAGLQNLNYSHIIVKKVQRIENIHLFKKYVEHRNDHFKKAVSKNGPLKELEAMAASKGPVLTTNVLGMDFIRNHEIYPEINEHYFFHGTKADVVDTILNQGLDSRLAGDKAMFGAGVYCAENSTKSDQYSDYKGNRSSGSLKMLLVRLCLGEIYVESNPIQYKRAPCQTCEQDRCNCKDNEFYDSVVGDGKWIFREFVVYNGNQAYPEYLITYKRN